MKKFFLQNFSEVVVGTGIRNIEMLELLELKPTRFSVIAGEPTSWDHGSENVVLADGTEISREKYTSLNDLKECSVDFLFKLKPNSIILAGRPFMVQIGLENPKSAALYKIDQIGRIFEVHVAGESEHEPHYVGHIGYI